MKRTSPTLNHVLDRYFTEHTLSPRTRRNFRENLGCLNHWNGRAVSLPELTDGLLNAWIISQEDRGCRRSTVRCRVQSVLTLWKFAHRAGLLQKRPENLIYLGRQRKGANA
jgi:site-specific recombinase XerD